MKTFLFSFFLLTTSLLAFAQPNTFDLRDYDGVNYVTPVKSQQGGTCWTHGSFASVEGNLLMTGNWTAAGEVGEPDLAEYHLDWWNGFNTFNNDDLTPPTGNGLTPHQGGDYMVTTAYLSRLDGAIREVDAPQSYSTAPERRKDSYHYYYPRDVEWFELGEGLEGIDLIKNVIMENGVLAICMCVDNAFWNGNIHYQPPTSDKLPNHSIAVIGWDNDFVTQAPLPGAWLVKNSWGTGWGDGGYFWISYYDKWACREPEMGAISFSNVEKLIYDTVYYHDYHGWRDEIPAEKAFNRFDFDNNYDVVAVNFFCAANDVDFEVNVYSDFDGTELSNKLESISGHIDYKGFHTFDLDNAVSYTDNGDIYVELVLSEGGIPYDRTSDVPVLLGGTPGKTVVNSTSAENQSFYYDVDDAEWKDLYNYDDPSGFQNSGNFCIKALANYTEVGVGTVEEKSLINCYPQPASDILNISGDANLLTVYNLAGQVVLTEKVSGSNNSLNVETLKAGIYLLEVSFDGKSHFKKISIK